MPEIQPITTTNLLKDVNKIIRDHEALARERGEDFNLFSIMSMENNETYTHSAVIVALLNPKGNHYKEDLFLKLFLDEIEYDYTGENLKQTKILSEYHVGKIDKDYTSGGFIDILIIFNSGKTITIENKIFAKDQRRQLYRYSRHNVGNSFIYYLNLFGTEPSTDSCWTLEKDMDFKIISYKIHITAWLKKCLNNSKKELIVNSSLKQYQLLIQKLTYTMDRTREKELESLIINNLDAAKYVSHNYDKIIYSIREKFRHSIIEKLKAALTEEEYLVKEGNSADSQYSQIFVSPNNKKSNNIEFGLESFSGRGNDGGKLFVGIIDRSQKGANFDFVNETTDKFLSKWWPVMRLIKTVDGNNFHLNSEDLLRKLSDKNSQIYTSLADHVTKQTVAFIEEYTSTVIEMRDKALIEEV